MVHTMHIFLLQLDMQHLVLLPCMTILDQFMEVSTIAGVPQKIACEFDTFSQIIFLCLIRRGVQSRIGQEDFCWQASSGGNY